MKSKGYEPKEGTQRWQNVQKLPEQVIHHLEREGTKEMAKKKEAYSKHPKLPNKAQKIISLLCVIFYTPSETHHLSIFISHGIK